MEREGDDLERTQAVDADRTATLQRFAALRRGGVFAGRYALRERLGAGGAGEVFRAHDRLAGIDIALKILYPRADDDIPDAGPRDSAETGDSGGDSGRDSGGDSAVRGALPRLRREMKLVRSLDHPGIVRVHDLGEHDGLFYVVMDLLAGETLRARLARGTMRVDEATRIAEGMLGALAHAHAKRIVHRDVKPANVFLVKGDASSEESIERVVLLDFGLAREGVGGERLTATGAFLGTPEYVSPEQARGDATIGPPTDVYSAGIVLWEMLAGRPPFVGESAMEVVRRHLVSPLPARAMPRTVPPRMRALAYWMLEKNPRARPCDAGAALASLTGRSSLPWRRRLPRVRLRWYAVAATLALAALAIIPARIEVSGENIRRRSALGVALPVERVPRAFSSLPLGLGPWRGDRLLALGARPARDPGADPYPLGLARTGRWSMAVPFRLAPDAAWHAGSPHGFPRFDRRMTLVALEPVPWLTAGGRRGFLAVYNHIDQYPSIAVMFDDTGHVDWAFAHPGWLGKQPHVAPSSRSITFSGINNALGSRGVIVRISSSAKTVDSTQTTWYAAPPFTGAGAGWTQPGFYVPLSHALFAQIDVAGSSGRIHLGGSTILGFDAESGYPLDRDARGGLDPRTWLAGLESAQGEVAKAAGAGDDTRADPSALIAVAERDDVPLAARGVAIFRATQILRAHGRLEEAYRLALRGVELEPEVPGHARAVVDLATRLGHWQTAFEDLASRNAGRGVTLELERDRVIAALYGEEPERAMRESGGSRVPSYGPFEIGLIEVQGREYQRAAQTLTDAARSHPECAFLRALALSLAPDLRCDEALSDLEFAESGQGSGWALPFEPLRAQLARRCPRVVVAPLHDDIERALADQRRAARTNIVDLYFVPWGEHLAYGTPLAWGPALVRKVHRTQE